MRVLFPMSCWLPEPEQYARAGRKRPGRFARWRAWALCGWLWAAAAHAGLPSFQQNGNLLVMSNVNVRLEYNLGTGRSDFYWQNAKKITGFYAGVGLAAYVTGTGYSNRTWTVLSSNQVVVAGSAAGLPVMKQYFILDQDNSFLTRVAMESAGTNSNWMGPVVVDTTGGVDLGSYSDARALYVPFDNDHFVRYNAMPLNSTSTGYEVGAFYDNTSRNGLVVGSVTHDTWKTGIYFAGSANKLNKLNVFGGATSASATWDVVPHGAISGTNISSPTVFVGFGTDWRAVLESYADANALLVPKVPWTNGVPFGWNSWYAFTTTVSHDKAVAVSDFIKNNLQAYNFNDNGTVYVNLDSYWDNLSASQLVDFVNHCHANGQKAGIYWSPWVWWGAPANLSNAVVEGSSYRYSDVALRTPSGLIQTNDGAIAMDPTHPGIRQRVDYYIGQFLSQGFDFVKLDFLSHGAMEGVHYDPTVTTGIQAYNQGMRYLFNKINGRMFISASIAPLFPYHYAHARRIACDTSHSISDTAYEMQSVSYGWWLSGRLYQFNDPDLMQFAGADANENQSRLISGAVSGTVFLNSDDVTSATGQTLALTCLTNAGINAVARLGQTFRPVEGNTGTSAEDSFVLQNGADWYLALFNYSASATNQTVDFARAGLPASVCGALDLWSGTLTPVSGSLSVSLAAKQAKLFKLTSRPTAILTATPVTQSMTNGGTVTYTLNLMASGCLNYPLVFSVKGLPPGASASFSPPSLSGSGSATLSISLGTARTSADYRLGVTAASAELTNAVAVDLVVTRTRLAHLRWDGAAGSVWDISTSADWFNLDAGANDTFFPGDQVLLDDTPGVSTGIMIGSGVAVTPAALTNDSSVNNFLIYGAGKISGNVNLVKKGTSTLVLSTANDFSGSVSILQGTLKEGIASALGAATAVVSITNPGTLDLNGYGLGAQPVIVAGGGAHGGGAVINSGGPVYDNGNALTAVTLAGDATFGGPTRWDLGGSAGGSLSTGGQPWNLTLAGTAGGIYYEWMNLSVDPSLATIRVLPGATLGDKGSTSLGDTVHPVVLASNASLTFYNSGVSVTLNKPVLVGDGATVRNGGGATVALQPITLGTNAAGAPGNCTFNVGSTSLSLSNALLGPGNLVKVGGSPLNLAATNTFTGATFINAGTLALKGNGCLPNSPSLTVAANATLDVTGRADRTLTLSGGQTLAGHGTLSGSLAVPAGAVVAPGAPVGALAITGAALLQGRGVYACGIIDATNAPGFGYDTLNVSGAIGVQATSANPFTLRLLSLGGNGAPGSLTNFDNNTSYLWTVAAGTVTNFDVNAFTFDLGQFTNDLAGGAFLVQTGALAVVFTNNHPPVAAPMTVVRSNGAPLRLSLASVAANWSDPDGDPVALLAVGASTNGVTVATNATDFLYYNPNNVPDSFTYTVRDLRASYRPGDTVRTATGTIYLQPAGAAVPNAALSVSGAGAGTNRLVFSGWPGYSYVVQFTTKLPADSWFNLSTNTADANGLWTVLDSTATNAARFYRSVCLFP
jgi:autotransporter-associated beta strand protein